MYRNRVVPCLLVKGDGLVKTIRFKSPKYLGDPINAVKIFNDKEVDELVMLDIGATIEKRPPNFKRLQEITSEAFMPLCYGGGIRNAEEIRKLFRIGVEKIALNSVTVQDPDLVTRAATIFGNQSVVVSIDAKKNFFGQYRVVIRDGTKMTGLDPVVHARAMVSAGAGEILLTSVDRDGTMSGFDLGLIQRVSNAVPVPVVACGGAGSVADLAKAISAGASAAAAGSLFVFTGIHRAVLISYPSQVELAAAFQSGYSQLGSTESGDLRSN